jgi:hypothetical protein
VLFGVFEICWIRHDFSFLLLALGFWLPAVTNRLSPRWGLSIGRSSHGLRRGLHSSAASRLKPDFNFRTYGILEGIP